MFVQATLRESALPVGWKTAAQSALRLRLRSKSNSIAAILDAMCTAGGSVGPGLLGPVGWRRAVQRLGLRLSARQCDELFEVIDTNNDNAVDLHELLAWVNAEQGPPAPTADLEHNQIPAASVSQEQAIKKVAAAIATVVRQQFGGSAETAFLHLLEVTPLPLNQPDRPQLVHDIANPDDLDDLSEIDVQGDETCWRQEQQEHQQEQKDRCGIIIVIDVQQRLVQSLSWD